MNPQNVFASSKFHYRRLLVVIKQTAYEEYSQLKLRGQAPKALRWKRLENRYKAHKQCVNDLLGVLRHYQIQFSCVNRVELDRQHLSDIDLVVAVGGDGTVLSTAHFLDHGTIPLLGINSDPISEEEMSVGSVKKKTDERRSHGALCFCTARNMHNEVPKVLYGDANLSRRTRIRCIVKSTFSETRLVPALNDILITNPSPAAVSRFRMGWLSPLEEEEEQLSFLETNNIDLNDTNTNGEQQKLSYLKPSASKLYGTVTRFSGAPYDVNNSLNVWSSGLWISTATGSSAAILSAGGNLMPGNSPEIQYLIREHMIEKLGRASCNSDALEELNKGFLKDGEQLYLRWNSHKGKIYLDGSHLFHDLDLGDEILINNQAPPLSLFMQDY